jgi:hypothetical protein
LGLTVRLLPPLIGRMGRAWWQVINAPWVANGTSFPYIPDQNTFVNLGLNRRPTFFGCDSANSTGSTPLLSSFTCLTALRRIFEYKNTERDAIILNSYNVATMGNASGDLMWPVWVGCAMLSRSLERTETVVPEVCRRQVLWVWYREHHETSAIRARSRHRRRKSGCGMECAFFTLASGFRVVSGCYFFGLTRPNPYTLTP